MRATPRFRLSTRRVMLTYKGHLSKESLGSFLKTKVTTAIHIKIAHETGRTGYQHSHALVRSSLPMTTTNQRWFDYRLETGEEIHPNISPITTDLHWNRACSYVEKEDPDCWTFDDRGSETANDGAHETDDWLSKIMGAESLEDALRSADIRTASSVIAIYEKLNKKPRIGGGPPELHGWQEQVVNMSLDPRHITWIYDLDGGKGKSFLTRYLNQWKQEEWMTLACAPTQRDLSSLVQGATEKGWNGSKVLLDLPRAYQCRDMYPGLEDLSNGHFTTVKYVGRTFTTNPLCVVVCANFLPDLKKMSMDRWRVMELRYPMDKQPSPVNAELRTLTLAEVRSMQKENARAMAVEVSD